LAPSDFHLLGPSENTWRKTFWWWRRGWKGVAEVAETPVSSSMLRVSTQW
jgi:hypothetical protein